MSELELTDALFARLAGWEAVKAARGLVAAPRGDEPLPVRGHVGFAAGDDEREGKERPEPPHDVPMYQRWIEQRYRSDRRVMPMARSGAAHPHPRRETTTSASGAEAHAAEDGATRGLDSEPADREYRVRCGSCYGFRLRRRRDAVFR